MTEVEADPHPDAPGGAPTDTPEKNSLELCVDWHAVTPIVCSLMCAVVIFLALAHVDDLAQRAQWVEASGQARGAIVDRFGHELAYSTATARGSKRVYALPGLAPILGYRSPDARWHGLEHLYSGFLDAVGARHDWRSSISHLLGKVVRGDTVKVTISQQIEAVATAALGNATGAVVALDPRTGGVLAMVTKPSCPSSALDSSARYRRCVTAPDGPLVNRAIGRVFAPGSDFKIVTLTAALDSGRFHLSDVFSGADVFGPNPYFDNSVYPSNVTRSDLQALTLSQALAFSDNFTFAHIGLTIGAPTLIRYARRYRIGQSIPFDLPVAISSIANGKAHPSKSELAQSAFGAEVDKVTPLQMALVAGTVANGGVLMAPHLVQSVLSPDGKVLRSYVPKPIGRVMSRTTAADITSAMSFVVNHGSGFKAQIHGVQVAGKTGTAASGGNRANAWFICFAPARHPVVAVAVLHEFSGEGFEYAAPIARKVLVAALNEHGFKLKY